MSMNILRRMKWMRKADDVRRILFGSQLWILNDPKAFFSVLYLVEKCDEAQVYRKDGMNKVEDCSHVHVSIPPTRRRWHLYTKEFPSRLAAIYQPPVLFEHPRPGFDISTGVEGQLYQFDTTLCQLRKRRLTRNK